MAGVMHKGRAESQRSASARNLQKARKAHRAGNQTDKQLRAERANLVAARAALKAKKTGQANNKAAQQRRLALEQEIGPTQGYGSSYTTLSQLITLGESFGFAKRLRHDEREGYLAARRTYLMENLVGKAHPLGMVRIAINMWKEPSRRNPTGIFQPFRPRLSPWSFEGRTTWKTARQHKFRKRLHIRKHKVKALKHWRHRKHSFHPR